MRVDILAVVIGVFGGIGVAVISHLIMGPDATVIGGSVAAAAFISSIVTNARARQRGG